MRRTILVSMGDQHAGHKFGLMNPLTVLFDEDEQGNRMPYTPTPTAMQEYLWGIYLSDILIVIKIAGDDEILLLNGGDEVHGNKYPQQLVSTRMSDQIIMAVANMEPWYALQNVTHVRLVTGTGAHSFLEGSSTMLLCEFLKGKYPEIDTTVLNHGLLEYNGLKIDYSHHGPFPGSRDWLRGNVARFYLRDAMYQDIVHSNKPPDLVLRHHYHSPVHEMLEMNGYSSELYVLPSMCGLSEHALQSSQSSYALWNGILAIEIVDGEIVKRHKLYDLLDLRTKEVI